MKDQAERLREIVNKLRENQTEKQYYFDHDREKSKKARIITIASGKGGVGKSNIAVSIAIALSGIGYGVALIDADLGLANVDVILGITPRFSLADVVNYDFNIMDVLSKGPGDISFISGGSGIEELAKMDKEKLERFITNIEALDELFDIIIMDTGAGLSDNILSFAMAADEVIIVTTPDPTAITDAYALIKTIAVRDRGKNIKVIVNRAENIREGNDVLNKLIMVSERFIKMRIYPLGVILYDDAIVRAVKQQQPFILSSPNSQASRAIKEIASNLTEDNNYMPTFKTNGIKGFVKRLSLFFNN